MRPHISSHSGKSPTHLMAGATPAYVTPHMPRDTDKDDKDVPSFWVQDHDGPGRTEMGEHLGPWGGEL